MDAFKLLTRSTKLKPAASTTASRLPSAGKAENPQLFGSAEDVKSTRKRKRGGTTEIAEAHGEKNDEFEATQRLLFGGGGGLSAPAPNTTGSKESSKKARKSKNDTADQQDDSDGEQEEQADLMEESERRSIMKTHKIKVVDLRDLDEILADKADVHDGDDSSAKKKKKKKSSKKAPSLSKKKQKEARQLYPEPLMSFQDLRKRYRISRRLAENISEQGFSVPTEVQMGSLPLLLGNISVDKTTVKDAQGPDLLAVAPTGSGKTLAFLIPLINKTVNYHRETPEKREISSVVVLM